MIFVKARLRFFLSASVVYKRNQILDINFCNLLERVGNYRVTLYVYIKFVNHCCYVFQLCQLMLDSGVFEPVNHKSASSFEDQSCKLFRFLPDADAENNDSCHLCHEVIADKARYFQITCHKIKFISQKAKS